MGILGFLKKEEIPDELPDLASDEIEEEMREVSKELKEKTNKNIDPPKEISETTSFPENEDPQDIKTEASEPETKVEQDDSNSSEDNFYVSEVKKAIIKNDDSLSKSFFEELQQNISQELSNITNLEDWYKKKFVENNLISEMRGYWEDQKKDMILESFSKSFKLKVLERTKKLQDLEKEWQNVYFDLIEKEEEIKDEEAELKGLVSEFLEACKRKKERLEKDEQENKTEKSENQS